MAIQQKVSYLNNKKHIGEVMDGIVIGLKNKQYLIRTYFNAPDDIDGSIYVTSDCKLSLGDSVKVRITSCSTYDLEGEIL